MSFPISIIETLKACDSSHSEWRESNLQLIAPCNKLSATDIEKLKSHKDIELFGCKIEIEIGEDSDYYEPLETISPQDNRCSIYIAKPNRQDHLFFFLSSLAAKWAEMMPAQWEKANLIWLGDITIPSDTANASIRRWTEETELPPDSKMPLGAYSPRKVVRNRDVHLCPNCATAWIIDAPQNADKHFTEAFLPVMTRRLSYSLSTEVWMENGEVQIELRGVRRKKICDKYDENFLLDNNLYNNLSNAALWIYTEGQEFEVKHDLLVAELAREWEDANWITGLSTHLGHALENARMAYSMHVHDVSRDALHQMSELRKSVSDDMQNMSSQITKLLSALWRDAAIAFGFIIIRASFLHVPRFTYYIFAAYLFLSISLSLTNYLGVIKDIERYKIAFRKRLYGFISNQDFNTLYDSPIERTKKRSILFCALITIFYFALITFALFTATTNSKATTKLNQQAESTSSQRKNIPNFPLTLGISNTSNIISTKPQASSGDQNNRTP